MQGFITKLTDYILARDIWIEQGAPKSYDAWFLDVVGTYGLERNRDFRVFKPIGLKPHGNHPAVHHVLEPAVAEMLRSEGKVVT